LKKLNRKTLIKSSGGTGPMKLGNHSWMTWKGAKSCKWWFERWGGRRI